MLLSTDGLPGPVIGEEVREAGDGEAEVGARARRPTSRCSVRPPRPRMSMLEQRAGHGVEAGGEDDGVERVLGAAGAHARRA